MTVAYLDRKCVRCEAMFSPLPSIEARMLARGSTGAKVCAACVLAAIDDMAAESIAAMSDEEIEAELLEDGTTPDELEAFKKRVMAVMDRAKGGAQ